MANRWNPNNRTTNCGFCAISYALEIQNGRFTLSADDLYENALHRLQIERTGDGDPISRQLIFPQVDLDSIRAGGAYAALEGGARSLGDYTISAIANAEKLHLLPGSSKDIVNSILNDPSSGHKFLIDDFVRRWMVRPGMSGKITFERAKKHIEQSVGGEAIIGSTTAKHYLTMSLNQRGELRFFDPQKGGELSSFAARGWLTRVDFFERVQTSAFKL